MNDITDLMAAMDAVKKATDNHCKLLEMLSITADVLQQFNERLSELEARMDKQERGFDVTDPEYWKDDNDV